MKFLWFFSLCISKSVVLITPFPVTDRFTVTNPSQLYFQCNNELYYKDVNERNIIPTTNASSAIGTFNQRSDGKQVYACRSVNRITGTIAGERRCHLTLIAGFVFLSGCRYNIAINCTADFSATSDADQCEIIN